MAAIPVADEAYDVVVAGASFAGLSFAGAAAAHGLRVLVLERDPSVGGVVRTTGILFSDVLDIMDVPPRFLLNAVRRLHIEAPHQLPIEVESHAYRFFMADVTGMLRWMAEYAISHGATVCCAAPFVDATPIGDGAMRVSYGTPQSGDADSKYQTVMARFLVGADGAHSHVARKLGLQQNTAILAGAEWLVEGIPLDGETFHLIMSHALAPGYALWLAPHGDIAALGVAGRQREFKPNESLRAAQTLFGQYIDMSRMRVVQHKGGVIPVGGRLQRVYRDDEHGRALLIGDAAGLCGAMTGGGIYPAILCGRLAAHAVANEVLNGTRGAVRAYLRNLPHVGRLGQYLRLEDWIRLGMNQLRSDDDLGAFYGLFTTPEGQAMLRRLLFETPIISMDGSFAATVRGLLSRNPAFYRSALHAVWRHLLARVRGTNGVAAGT